MASAASFLLYPDLTLRVPDAIDVATVQRIGWELRYGRLAHATPSFFCRLVDDVVYWNTSRLSGNT